MIPLPDSDFVPPRSFSEFLPVTLIEIETRHSRTQPLQPHSLVNRVALAFFLSGYQPSSSGTIVTFEKPSWASHGISHPAFAVSQRMVAGRLRSCPKINSKRSSTSLTRFLNLEVARDRVER